MIRQLVVRFELAPGLHIYDNPVSDGMVATHIEVSGPAGFMAEETIKLPTHALALPGLDTELQVLDGRVDFVIPVWVDDRVAGPLEEREHDEIQIDVAIRYQACDDRACRTPQTEALSLRVPVAPFVGHLLPGRMDGADITTMDSRKHMMRLVRRGLLRSPIMRFKYIRDNMAALGAVLPEGRSARRGSKNSRMDRGPTTDHLVVYVRQSLITIWKGLPPEVIARRPRLRRSRPRCDRGMGS